MDRANISVDFGIRTFPEDIAMENLFQNNENKLIELNSWLTN